jgi:hypothetical protein
MSEIESALARPARTKRSLSSTMLLALGVLVAGGFVGGLLLGRATAPESTALPGNFPGGGTGATGGNVPGGSGFTAGTIQRIDGDTFYVETADGQTVEVQTNGDTVVQVTSEGSVDDLAEGETVIVQGDQQDDNRSTHHSRRRFRRGAPRRARTAVILPPAAPRPTAEDLLPPRSLRILCGP